MSELFAAFGVDWRLLVINLINFGLMLFVLWYFLYEPILRVLEDRRKKIAEGVRKAEEAAQALQEIETNRTDMLAQAGKEADSVISEARAAGAQKQRDIVTAAETTAAGVIKEAQREAVELKEAALRESKQEVAKLIVLGMEKAMIEKK